MKAGENWLFVAVPKTASQSMWGTLPGSRFGQYHAPLFHVEKGNRFAFGFVRNPWARLVSFYHHLQRRMNLGDMTFEHFVMRHSVYQKYDRSFGVNLTTLQLRPQTWWVRGCDFVGRYESLQQDFDTACDMIGLSRKKLPHKNATQKVNWRLMYTPTLVDFVGRAYEEDTLAFGYRFE